MWNKICELYVGVLYVSFFNIFYYFLCNDKLFWDFKFFYFLLKLLCILYFMFIMFFMILLFLVIYLFIFVK